VDVTVATNVALEDVGQIDRDDHPDSTYWAWSHTDHVNLRLGLIQIVVRKPTEDFCSSLVGNMGLVGPFRLNWACCSVLIGIIKAK
jgi:hypothetical protein